jgi:hypothetical protein
MFIAAAAFAAILVAAPVSAKIEIDKKPLKDVKKVAILTMSVDNIGKKNPMESNDKFMMDAAEYALGVYTEGLKGLGKWEIVPTPDVSELEGLMSDIAASPITTEILNKMADQNKLPGEIDKKVMMELAMASMLGKKDKVNQMKPGLIAGSAKQLQDHVNSIRGEMVWAKSTVGLPYWIMNAKKSGEGLNGALYDILDKAVQAYCARNGLDAVILLHIKSDVGPADDVKVIVSDSRVLSSFRINTAIVLRTNDGKPAVHNGTPNMDDLASYWKLAVPIYKGDRTDSKAMAGDLIRNLRLDLADPAGKSYGAYQGLIQKNSDGLMKDLNKKLPK